MTIKIINSDGCCSRTDNVEMSDAQTHIAACDQWSVEAEILLAYASHSASADCDPIAWKWADPTEDARFIYTEEEVEEIEREDPSLIERVEVVWEVPGELPANLDSIEEVRWIGLAGLVFLGELDDEEPIAVFSDDDGNTITVYEDDSMKLDENGVKLYPTYSWYLWECAKLHEDKATQELRAWADQQ